MISHQIHLKIIFIRDRNFRDVLTIAAVVCSQSPVKFQIQGIRSPEIAGINQLELFDRHPCTTGTIERLTVYIFSQTNSF